MAEGKEYSILTAEIARTTFGVTPGEHSQLKGLDVVKAGNNLRDHMTDLELIFTMLGEASTTEIARRSDALGFDENRTSAKEGGKIAGNARKALEAKAGKKVVSKANDLPAPTTSELLEDIPPAQPAKSKARQRQPASSPASTRAATKALSSCRAKKAPGRLQPPAFPWPRRAADMPDRVPHP